MRGLKRPDLVADGRKQLVGLLTKDRKVVLEEGAQIVADPNQAIPMTMIGHVTSSYWSENCGHSIALALLVDGHEPHRRDAIRADAGPHDRRGSHRHGVLRQGRGAAQWLNSKGADRPAAGRRGPLDGRKGGSGLVVIEPARQMSRLSLRVRGEGVASLSAALGLALPTQPKRSNSAGERHALWLGPDEWLLIDEGGADLAAAARQADLLHSAVDISHRNVGIIVSGEGAEATLAAGCPQDLSAGIFPPGACSRTLMGKIEVVIWRRAAATYHVECWRSFAGYAFDFLHEAARDAAA